MNSELRPLIFHYHIFKNAGTSFNWSLKQYFKGSFFEYDPVLANGILSPEEIIKFATDHPEANVISSHQAFLPVPQLPNRQVVSTILIRDPIARIRSIYNFERMQKADNSGANKAKELGFKDYIEWRLDATPNMLCNYQVHYCSRTLETFANIPGEEQFQKAVSNLKKIRVVGTVERYNEWLQSVELALQKNFPRLILNNRHLNISTKSSSSSDTEIINAMMVDLGEDLVSRLLKSNELDMRLLQEADSLLGKNSTIRPI